MNFVLSQPVTGLCTAGDPRLLLPQLDACQQFARLSAAELEALVAAGREITPLFA